MIRKVWRRRRADDLEDRAVRVADDVQLAVGIDAERADVAQSRQAAQLGRVLAHVAARASRSVELIAIDQTRLRTKSAKK